MGQQTALRCLQVFLVVTGLFFIFGVYIMMMWVAPESWGWTPRQYEYEQMIMGIYATLGVFLVLAAKDPLANASLIWFTVWSSVVHGLIMLVQALVDSSEHANLMGDVPALLVLALVLGYLMRRASPAASSAASG